MRAAQTATLQLAIDAYCPADNRRVLLLPRVQQYQASTFQTAPPDM